MSRQRSTLKRVVNRTRTVPTEPGEYYWDHWKANVRLVQRGRALYVTPPAKNAVEVRVTPNIAGTFTKI